MIQEWNFVNCSLILNTILFRLHRNLKLWHRTYRLVLKGVGVGWKKPEYDLWRVIFLLPSVDKGIEPEPQQWQARVLPLHYPGRTVILK